MSGPLHRVARWVRLALACLVLAGASAPAHAQPEVAAVVAVWAERNEAARQHTAAEAAPAHQGYADTDGTRVHESIPFEGGIREARSAGPPRRLFIIHRALLH